MGERSNRRKSESCAIDFRTDASHRAGGALRLTMRLRWSHNQVAGSKGAEQAKPRFYSSMARNKMYFSTRSCLRLREAQRDNCFLQTLLDNSSLCAPTPHGLEVEKVRNCGAGIAHRIEKAMRSHRKEATMVVRMPEKKNERECYASTKLRAQESDENE